MKKLPTAEEFLIRQGCYRDEGEEGDDFFHDVQPKDLIAFAKLHCKRQAEVIAEKVKLTEFACEFLQEGVNKAIDKDSILNAYPEEEIK